MNRVLTLALALVVLAVFQAAVAALVVALAIMLLFYVATRPKETLIFIGTLLLFGLSSARPIACLVVVGVVALIWTALDAKRKTQMAWPKVGSGWHRPHKPDEIQQKLLK